MANETLLMSCDALFDIFCMSDSGIDGEQIGDCGPLDSAHDKSELEPKPCSSCMPECLKVIRTLHSPQSTRHCVFDSTLDSASYHQQAYGRTLGQVLAINRLALQCGARAMQCQSCWKKPAVQLFVSIICDKLISWTIIQSSSAAVETTHVISTAEKPLSSLDLYGTGSSNTSMLEQSVSKVASEAVLIGEHVIPSSESLTSRIGLLAAMDSLQATERLLRTGERQPMFGAMRSSFSGTVEYLESKLMQAKSLTLHEIQKHIVNSHQSMIEIGNGYDPYLPNRDGRNNHITNHHKGDSYHFVAPSLVSIDPTAYL
ncbi:hypothetical protein MferCBS49748_002853 [Microsporum ferrugineum]